MDKSNLINETKELKKKVSESYEMVGESESINQIKEMIDRVAPSDARVFITGNNGTGKEIVARWLHQKSNRARLCIVDSLTITAVLKLVPGVLFNTRFEIPKNTSV